MEHHYHKYVAVLRKKTGGQVVAWSGLSLNTDDSVSLMQHYVVAKKDRDHVDLYTFTNQHTGNPALRVGYHSHYLSPMLTLC